MKIIDCFPFYDEFLMLDIRFRELYDVVDKFVIVEAAETFTGQEKPSYLEQSMSYVYPQYQDKIHIIKVPRVLATSAWKREYFQKNFICKENLVQLGFGDDDIILSSDADEIPRRLFVESLREGLVPISTGGIGGPTYYYKFNILTSEWSYRPRFSPLKDFSDHTKIRYDESLPVIRDAGWHFSSIKHPKSIKRKIEAFSHQEFNNDTINSIHNISESIKSVSDMFGRPEVTMNVVDIDETFPEYIKENIDALSEWIA